MIDSDCITPKVVTSTSWGQAAKAMILDVDKDYSCCVIAPDSEAHGVELRLDDKTGFAQSIIVTKDSPYFGALNLKGLGVYPLYEVPDNDTDEDYEHYVKLYFYRTPPPFISHSRALARYQFAAANSENALTGDLQLPLIPAFGRKRVFFNIRPILNVGGDIDIVFSGGHTSGQHAVRPELVTDRWPRPSGVPAVTGTWPALTTGIHWATLYTESGITASARYAFQYEGNFDFYRIGVTHNAGSYSISNALTLLED